MSWCCENPVKGWLSQRKLWERGKVQAGLGQSGTVFLPKEQRYAPSWRCSIRHTHESCPAKLAFIHPHLLPPDGALCSVGHNYTLWPVLMKANIFSFCMWLLLCWRGLEKAGQGGGSLGEWKSNNLTAHFHKPLHSQQLCCPITRALHFRTVCASKVCLHGFMMILHYVGSSKSVFSFQLTHLAGSSHTRIWVNSSYHHKCFNRESVFFFLFFLNVSLTFFFFNF